jgi:hypothetical protein
MTAIAVQLGLDRFFAVITAVLLRLGDLAAAGRMRALSFLLRFYVCHTPLHDQKLIIGDGRGPRSVRLVYLSRHPLALTR